MRGRGLKFVDNNFPVIRFHVAPYEGAWIEISLAPTLCALIRVAPYEGAWIEIT